MHLDSALIQRLADLSNSRNTDHSWGMPASYCMAAIYTCHRSFIDTRKAQRVSQKLPASPLPPFVKGGVRRDFPGGTF
jgi:hypothetical protein